MVADSTASGKKLQSTVALPVPGEAGKGLADYVGTYKKKLRAGKLLLLTFPLSLLAKVANQRTFWTF